MEKAADCLKNQIYARYIDKEHNVEVGIHMVIYGWRIRAGYIGSDFCNLDYCCGNNPNMVVMMLSIVKSILEKHNCDFKVFPRQDRKPMLNDMDCFGKLLLLADTNFKLVDIPPLHELRLQITNKIMEEFRDR